MLIYGCIYIVYECLFQCIRMYVCVHVSLYDCVYVIVDVCVPACTLSLMSRIYQHHETAPLANNSD